MPVVRFNGKKLDPATIKALVAGTLVNGSKPSVWWNRQSIDFRNSFMDTIRTSMRNGESLTQAAARINGGIVDGVSVPGIMKTTKSRATALAATSMSAVTNEAALKTFQENNDVIKAITQVSTLDNKTSDICVAYSGQTWDVNTLQPVMGGSLPFNGGPPRHFNCRSRLRPVTMSFKELGIDKAEIPAGTRASMDGQVPADITFNQFLKKKGVAFQDELLGPARAQLYRNGDITLTQLVDMRGNPMTIAQLEARLGIKPKAIPKKAPKPSKKVNSFIENDDGSFVQITQAEHDEIVGYARRLTAAADEADDLVTSQIKGLADDVGAKFPDAPIVKDGPDVVEGSLHWRKKDLDSTSRKIQTYARDRNITYTEAADQISDSLRYTYLLDEDDYIRAVQDAMERFAELGYKNGKFDPAWLLRPDYKGLNINMISPQGVRIEIQFHTAASFEVKNGVNHELYEVFRKLSKKKQLGPEGQALQAEMLANAQAIPVPKNIKALEDLAKIYNKPDAAAQAKILDAAKVRQLAAEEKFAKKRASELISERKFADIPSNTKFNEAFIDLLDDMDAAGTSKAVRVQVTEQLKKMKKANKEKFATEDVLFHQVMGNYDEAFEAAALVSNPSPKFLKVIKELKADKAASFEKRIRASLQGGDHDSALKLLIEFGDVKDAPKMKALHKEIQTANKLVDDKLKLIAEKEVKDFDEFSAFVKKQINEDPDFPDWARNKILNSDMFAKAEESAKWKLNMQNIHKLVDEGKIDDAVAAFEVLPPGLKGKPTLLDAIQDAKKNAEKITDALADKIKDIAINDLGFTKADLGLLPMSVDDLAKLMNGVLPDGFPTNLRTQLGKARIAMRESMDKVRALNKASKGMDEIINFAGGLDQKIRMHPEFQAVIKKVTEQAKKKAFDARNALVDDMIKQGKLTVQELDDFEKLITDAFDNVHKKLGKKQAEAKMTEIRAKVASAKKQNVSLAEFTADPTNYDEQVIALLDNFQMRQLDEAVQAFLKDGAGSSTAKGNVNLILTGKSAKQRRAIKEYIHRRVNPKKLANGTDFDAQVAEIVTKHVNNVEQKVINANMDAMLTGESASTKLHFQQTVMTRTGIKNLDDLGVIAEGDAPAGVLKIRRELKVNDPGNVPIPAHTIDEQMAAAKTWLHSDSLSDMAFQKQSLQQGKSMVASGKNVIREGDRIFGENSWGISPQEWQKWLDDVAPTLTEWDVALIHQYTGGMAGQINAGLYSGGTDLLNTAGARALNAALDKMPKHTGTVYRGTSTRANWSADYIDARYEVGKEVIERGFGSSSTQSAASFNGNLKFVIKTNGKNGAIMGHVGQYGTGEMEVLFKAGSKFKVLKKKRVGGDITVWMEEV